MQRRKVIPYNPYLIQFARTLRNNSTQSEILLWKSLKGKQMMGYDFHRQKPIDNYILDFFCPDLMLGIELDGFTHIYFEETVANDQTKEKRMNELGVTILRFSDNEVMNDLMNVLRAIESYIEEYQKHPLIPSSEGRPSYRRQIQLFRNLPTFSRYRAKFKVRSSPLLGGAWVGVCDSGVDLTYGKRPWLSLGVFGQKEKPFLMLWIAQLPC